MEIQISGLLVGIIAILFGVLSISHNKAIAKLYRGQSMNILSKNISELLTFILSPVWIIAGIYCIYHAVAGS